MSDKITPTPVRVAHLSDTHLALEAYRSLTPGGDNLRAVDMVRAFANAVDDICAWDPPLVIHSGDAFDKPLVPTRYLLFFSQQLQKLSSIRPDGTRRQVVIISGNHDQPRSRKEVANLELFASYPGVSVVTTGWSKIDFPLAGVDGDHPAAELSDVVVTAIPHDTLKAIDFDEIHPRPGFRDVLTTHAVAAGSDLYMRSLGREYPIPAHVLSQDWSYVALGHYHKQGPVFLGGSFAKVGSQFDEDEDAGPSSVGRIWYSGSTENCSFRDLRDNGEQRGYLRVLLPSNVKALPQVTRVHLPIRSMFRLPVLDATGLEPDQIQDQLISRIKDAVVAGAIVGQVITNLSRQMWSLVDLNKVKASASAAMHYELTPRYDLEPISAKVASAGILGDLPVVLQAAADARLAPRHRAPALELARTLLGKALQQISVEVSDSITPEDENTKPASLDDSSIAVKLLDTQHLAPANSDSLAAASDPAVAAARLGRDGAPTRVRKPQPGKLTKPKPETPDPKPKTKTAKRKNITVSTP